MTKRVIRKGAICMVLLLFTATMIHAKVNILVIPKGSKETFWKIVGDGAQQAGKELGISVTNRGPYSEDQHKAQIQIIEYGIRQGFDAIVIAPNHVKLIIATLREAERQGINIVLIDSNTDAAYSACTVSSDNVKAGQVAADHLAELLNGSGNIVMARHAANQASTFDRENGFMGTIQSHYPQIKILADPYVGPSKGSAYRTMSAMIDGHPDIDAIFSVAESVTLGTLMALKERNNPKKIKFIGFDFNTTIKNAIVNHEMDATIVQQPFQMGYMGVKAAFRLAQNENVPSKIYTDTILINAGNYNTDRVQETVRSYERESE